MSDDRTPDFDASLIEDHTEDDDKLDSSIRYSITSYGSDMPIGGLVDRLRRKDIFIPEFQRSFVWTIVQASRFIESLLLGLPVPGIFLFKEPETNRLMVVDGQQRLLTLQCFYRGVFRDKAFKLKGVSDIFSQKTYDSLGVRFSDGKVVIH